MMANAPRLSCRRYTDRQNEELQITFSSGLFRLLGHASRRRAASRGWGQSLCRPGLGRSTSVVATERRRTASAAVVGVIRTSGRQVRGHWLLSNSGALSRHAWHTVGRVSSADAGRSRRPCSSRPPCRMSASRASAVCRRRAALRVLHAPASSRSVGLARGSFERRYNPRLHQTAPRAFFPASPW